MQEHIQIVEQPVEWNDLPVQLQAELKFLKNRFLKGSFIEQIIHRNQDEINGIGVSWKNSLHPVAKYIRFAGEQPDQIIKSLLLHTDQFQKVVTSCDETNEATIATLKESGFNLFRKTYMFSKQLNQIFKDYPQFEKVTSNIVRLKEVQKDAFLEESLFKLVKENYEKTHLENEVKPMTWQTWSNLLYEDHPHFEFSKIIVEFDQVIAYIFVHVVSDEEVEIGWVGKRDDTVSLIDLLAEVLKELQLKGWKTAIFEIDTTDKFAMEFADLLSIKEVESWDSYLKIV